MTAHTPIIHWFRQDLRLADNPAFHAAAQTGKPVIALFILDDETPKGWKWGGASRWWLHHSLKALDEKLKSLGGRLILRRGHSTKVLESVLQETGAKTVYWNRLYQDFNRARDEDLKKSLKDSGIETKSFNGALLHEPWTVENKTGGFYKVYTPFSKACFEKGDPEDCLPTPTSVIFAPLPASETLDNLGLLPRIKWDGKFYKHWQPGEDGAHIKLENFIARGHIDDYYEGRNYPAKPHVSRLSPHLQWGEISPRQIWHRTRMYEATQTDKNILKSTNHFLKELLWREFSYHLLYHLEDMPRKPLNPQFNAFPWRDNEEHLEAWKRGQTGYPIVDAAMRELWQTGWMHNRSRMIVGSFLVKHLRLHWHHGEDWFWDCLVDADLASNSASWQWIAGCGADAAPYFRIFNPIIQSKKFDTHGDYIRTYVPELARMPNELIHTPWEASPLILKAAGVELGVNYPYPIVDHDAARQGALAAYETIKKAS